LRPPKTTYLGMATLNTLHRFHSSTAFGYAAATGLTTVTVLRALLLTMGAEECYRDRIYCSQFKSNHYHEQNPHRTPSASASETQWEAFTDMVRRRPLWLCPHRHRRYAVARYGILYDVDAHKNIRVKFGIFILPSSINIREFLWI
jgi:hypothetical protein